MKDVKILDCTLRDGGYVNNWDFGSSNIKNIINNLTDANIDIIECGFLSNKKVYDKDKSIFNSIEEISKVIPKERFNSKYVCMINYGEYEVEDIPDYSIDYVDGIRVVFHKNQAKEALNYSRSLSKKGYLVFIQPMVTINYTDIELLELVNEVNKINPYAFYIVDSFGVMKKNDLLRLFYLIDNNLNKTISIGYHSHNNLQLAYSNAQSLVEINSERKRILDSSVFGMGRGAGNLNTELFIEFLNENIDTKYKVYPLLQIIDDVLSNIYSKNYWGYSLPHYLSSTVNCHPNYASYLSEKNTLSVKSINDILLNLEENKKFKFDMEYIESLYLNHQKHNIDDKKYINILDQSITGKEVLLLAPGSNLCKYKNLIYKFIKNKKNILTISINFIPENFNVDFVFISNEKRFEKIWGDDKIKKEAYKFILSSNINFKDDNIININYINLINTTKSVSDNSSLMMLRLLDKLGVENVFVAGLDGYSYNSDQNYADKYMIIDIKSKNVEDLNKGISSELKKISNKLNIKFITPTKYN